MSFQIGQFRASIGCQSTLSNMGRLPVFIIMRITPALLSLEDRFTMHESLSFRDRSGILRFTGAAMLLAGLFLFLLAPLEGNTLTFFSAGGRFEYDGFGFGSLMFGNIVVQVFGYYFLAILLIPLGLGHLALRRWSRRMTRTLLYDWLVLACLSPSTFSSSCWLPKSCR